MWPWIKSVYTWTSSTSICRLLPPYEETCLPLYRFQKEAQRRIAAWNPWDHRASHLSTGGGGKQPCYSSSQTASSWILSKHMHAQKRTLVCGLPSIYILHHLEFLCGFLTIKKATASLHIFNQHIFKRMTGAHKKKGLSCRILEVKPTLPSTRDHNILVTNSKPVSFLTETRPFLWAHTSLR